MNYTRSFRHAARIKALSTFEAHSPIDATAVEGIEGINAHPLFDVHLSRFEKMNAQGVN